MSSYTVSTITIKEFYTMFKKGYINNPNYQRDLVWPGNMKKQLINDIIKGACIPSIIVSLRNGIHYIVDGQQRTSTIMDYLHEKYDDMVQIADPFLSYQIPIIYNTGYDITSESELFRKLNTSSKQLKSGDLIKSHTTEPLNNDVQSKLIHGKFVKYFGEESDTKITAAKRAQQIALVTCFFKPEYMSTKYKQIASLFDCSDREYRNQKREYNYDIKVAATVQIFETLYVNGVKILPFCTTGKYNIWNPEVLLFYIAYSFHVNEKNAAHEWVKFLSVLFSLETCDEYKSMLQSWPHSERNKILYKGTAKMSNNYELGYKQIKYYNKYRCFATDTSVIINED